jgi:DNA sulfur modification protein DndB
MQPDALWHLALSAQNGTGLARSLQETASPVGVIPPRILQEASMAHHTFYAMRETSRTTEYFSVNLDYGEVDQLIVLPEDAVNDNILESKFEMQRKLAWNRVKTGLVPYLENDDAFFNSLVLVIIPRTFEPLEEGEGYDFVSLKQDGEETPFGTLRLKSSCFLFPADGQHRAAGIKEYLRKHPKMAAVKTPALLIPFTARGKVQQLFSDLNLNAKPVNKTIGLAFDGRDPMAVLVKQVADKVPLFRDRVNHRANSLPKSSREVIALNSLYAGNKDILDALGVELTEGTLPDAAQRVAEVWQEVINCFPTWQDVMADKVSPSLVRDQYVFAHGLGWQALAKVAASVLQQYPSAWNKMLSVYCHSVDWSRTNAVWENKACVFVRDPASGALLKTRVNNPAGGIADTAAVMLSHGAKKLAASSLAPTTSPQNWSKCNLVAPGPRAG